jgi:hypothetical protein
MVQTPTGFRCKECANMQKLPTFKVGAKHYAIAIAVGLVMAGLCGFIWAYVMRSIPYSYLNFVIAPAIGSAIGEVISLAVNHKRSLGLAFVAGSAMVLTYLALLFSPLGMGFYLFDILTTILGVVAAVSFVR